MYPLLTLPFVASPDLAATMDIQIPALAWQPAGNRSYHRTIHLHHQPVHVEVTRAGNALQFHTDTRLAETDAATLTGLLRASFPTQIADLHLGDDPILQTLRDRYGGVIVMWADPFEALVLTVLSQNRSGETVRQVFPTLAAACAGATPANLAALGEDQLRDLIRSAGPYKAPRLAALAARIAADGEAAFTAKVTDAATEQALAYLESLPGVAHKTAACVLVFSARTRNTLPVDTHLFRVVDRLGLARHTGRHNKTTRNALISALLGYAPDLALAHFVFLLLGRTTCTAGTPACTACFLQPHCPHPTTGAKDVR